MTPALCDALLETCNADEQLNYVEKQGLFITRAEGEEGTIYICHPVLHDLLYTELCRQDPEHVRELHLRAIGLYHTLQDYDQALFHAYAARDNERAAQLILEVARPMLARGETETLANWIDALPASIFEQSPRLLLYRANIYLALKEASQALKLLTKARVLLEEPATIEDPLLQAEMLMAESVVWFEAGDYLRTQQLCQEALRVLSVDEIELRARVYQRLGMCASLLNDSATGILYMQQALQFWGYQRERLEIALLHGYLANAYNMVGNYALSEHHRERAIDSCTHLGNTSGLINNLVGMAITKRNKGMLTEAEKLLNEALTLARSIDFRLGEAYALENLGDIYLEQNSFPLALKVTEDALVLAQQLKDRYLGNHVLCTLAMIYLMMGDAPTAELLVTRTTVKIEVVVSYERALCELTRGTVLFFQQRYREAYLCLSDLEEPLRQAGSQRLYIRTSIRLAACRLCLGEVDSAIQTLEKLVDLVYRGNHEHLVAVELLRLPQLCQALKILPQAASLRAIRVSYYSPENDAVALPVVEKARARGEVSLRVQAFGEPAVFINETPVARWRMTRSMELYFFLLDAGRPLRKEQIIDALWPEPDEHIDQTLRSTIFYLRKAVGESCIVYKAGSYALDLASFYGEHVWYDVAVFHKQYAQAKEQLVAGNEEAGRQALREAVALYCGDYAQAFYSDWCRERRDELRSMYLEARKHLALIAMSNDELEESIAHWRQILVVDNCSENAHSGLIRCYLRQGKRGQALRQYQGCVEILQRELSVAPGPALRKLYQRMCHEK